MIRFGDLDSIFKVTRLIQLHEVGGGYLFSSSFIMKLRLYSLKGLPKSSVIGNVINIVTTL